MASDPHTVYYHAPVFKEDRFEHAKHEAFNQRKMEQTHPRQPSTVWAPTVSAEEKKRAQGDEALNQILIMGGLTAYRKGGWEDWETSDPHWDGDAGRWAGRVYANPGDKDKGFRDRVLTHGWVFCRWGRARRFGKDGQPADEAAVDGEGFRGFVEFRELDEIKGKWKGKRKKKEEEEGNKTGVPERKSVFVKPSIPSAVSASSGPGSRKSGKAPIEDRDERYR